MERQQKIRIELYNDNFQNYKSHGVPAKGQLVIADIPYNIGNNAYGSNPMWYKGGDNSNGESKYAGAQFFRTDNNFNIAEYFNFCSHLLKKEPKGKVQRGRSSDAPAMIVFCSFQQMPMVIEYGKKHGFNQHYPMFFIKNYSAQVLKANMRVVGAVENAVVLYRDRLPKFRNLGADGKRHMVFNWQKWERDSKKIYPTIHPTQKPVNVLKKLIETFTDPGDVVIDPVAGSGTTLRACAELGRTCYGFEVDKGFYKKAKEQMLDFTLQGVPWQVKSETCNIKVEEEKQKNLFVEVG